MVNPHGTSDSGAPLFEPSAADTQLIERLAADAPGSSRSGRRRAVWITAAAVAVIVAVAVPLIVFLTHAKPPRLATPASLAGMTRDDGSDATDTADYLQNALTAGMGLRNAVGAVYTDGRGDAHSVIFVGGASADGSQDARLHRIFGLFDDATDSITDLTNEAAGPLGGAVKCGLASDGGSDQASVGDAEMAVCGWADGKTVAIAMFPNRPITEAAQLLRQMRPGVQGKS